LTVWPPAHLTVVAACLPEQANGHLATCFSTRSSKMGLRHTVPPPALRHTVPPPALRHTVPPQKMLWKAGGVTTAPACTIKAALKVRPSAHHVVSQRSILSSCDKLSRRATSQSANQRPATSQSTNQRPATWPCEPRGSPELHGLLESVCHHRVLHLRSRFLGDVISGVMI
jgi:hypothetical protein